jgi:hypothetical protein
MPKIYIAAVLISFFLYIAEGYGMMLSSFFLFRFGVKIKATPCVNVNLNRFEIGKGYSTKHAKFTRVDENSCVFCHRFGLFRINTPFPIKGEIVRNGSGTQLTWRIPLGSTMFFSLWLLGWISPILGLLRLPISQIFSKDSAFSILVLLFGVFWVWFIWFISAKLEEKRARLALSELLFLSLHEQMS